MRTVSVTTTRTTAAHTELTGNVTPIDPQRIPLTLATIWVDFTTTVIVITKGQNAEICTTETAHAFHIVRHPKLPERAQLLADIMTSKFNSVSTVRTVALTTTKTANATATETRIFRTKLVQVSAVIIPVKVTNLDDMYVISTSYTITALIYRTWENAS